MVGEASCSTAYEDSTESIESQRQEPEVVALRLGDFLRRCGLIQVLLVLDDIVVLYYGLVPNNVGGLAGPAARV